MLRNIFQLFYCFILLVELIYTDDRLYALGASYPYDVALDILKNQNKESVAVGMDKFYWQGLS